MKNFEKFILQERNLGKIIRFSAKIRLKDESVAEHSFHVALYAMILADLEKRFGNEVDVEKLLRSALLHDLEESMTGDILYDFKHSDESLARRIKQMGLQFYEKLMKCFPEEMARKYIKLWKNAKDKSLEGRILEAADRLEALIYSLEEYSLGNKNFKPIIKKLLREVKATKLKSVELILKQIKIL